MKDYADITFILDRSGSMAPLANDVVGGFKQFVEDQKKVGDNACMTLVQFDDMYEVVYSGLAIKDVSPIIGFYARGWTALLDAVGKTINTTGHRLAAMPESDRPDKVIFVIFTDGEENASTEFTYSQVRQMVEEQKTKYNWTFLFLGTGIDAFSVGALMGINAHQTVRYDNSSKGLADSYTASSNYVSQTRTMSADMPMAMPSLETLYDAEKDKNNQ